MVRPPESYGIRNGASQRRALSKTLWRMAMLAAAGAIGAVSQADAAVYYWPDRNSGYYYYPSRPSVAPVQQQHKPRRRVEKKLAPETETAKPQGPLIISISIDKQSLKLYDANGLFAESPVSTGMRGHSTPTGVFSVIQKQRFHRSNIYSGAPMPFMQRITWSGIALHAGVLPGYPASHGCIRMPAAFAVKMWNWTRAGARVIITAGEITPAAFSHPLLVSQKVAPPPPVANEPAEGRSSTLKADKAAIKPVGANASLELRSSVGHGENAVAEAGEPPASAAAQEKTLTADARDALPVANPSTMSDAQSAPPRAVATPTTGNGDSAAAAAAGTGGGIPVPKDPARLSNADTSAPKPDPATVPKRNGGPIAIFVSRKDSRLYVRQNFTPLFDVPVTIAPNERPLGTHVFTARTDKNDANLLHWSVVSPPTPARHAERQDAERRPARPRKVSAEIKQMPLPDSPAEALDRLAVPADAMARIADALSTGSSIIVSDQGIAAGETGEGTDFIVSLR